MPSITTNRSIQNNESITLNNGNLVVLTNISTGIQKYYIVTSFRGDLSDYRKTNREYCTLIDLSTGYIAFEEPSSRVTTKSRLKNHFAKGYQYKGKYKQRNNEVANNFSVEVVSKDDYTIGLNY